MPFRATLQKLGAQEPVLTARRAALLVVMKLAAAHRRRLREVVFVGVTGSCGKSTTVKLVCEILAREGRGPEVRGTGNKLLNVATAILRTRAADAHSVFEIGAWQPGSVARAARIVRPNIAVVTNVSSDHRSAFRTLEATAIEKRALLEHTAKDATAVLNADDERVGAMAAGFRGRTVTFGRSAEAMLRAEDVSSSWPERLSFTLCHEGEALRVQTQLCGKHWVSSALGALGVATAMGVPLERGASTLATIEPCAHRMSPVERGDGVVFIRDDHKAPFWTVDAVLEFLADARAPRKIVVFGTFSDYAGSAAPKYRAVARRALEVADEVVYVGPNARYVRKMEEFDGGPLRAFVTVEEADEHLRATLRAGELVLLKGSLIDRLGLIAAG